MHLHLCGYRNQVWIDPDDPEEYLLSSQVCALHTSASAPQLCTQLCTSTSASAPMQGTATVLCVGMENFVRLLSVLPLGLIDAGPSADGSRRKSDSGRDESLDPTALRLALGQVGLHLCLASFAPLRLGEGPGVTCTPAILHPPHTPPPPLGAMALRYHGRRDGAAPAQVRHVPLRVGRYCPQPGFTQTAFAGAPA